MPNGRITVLVENCAGGRGLLAEHGLSFWLEIGGKGFLFDTGQGAVLIGNARRLGIHLEKTEAIILSHGHYDHTGGLGGALRSARCVSVYAHPAAFTPKFTSGSEGIVREIGMPSIDSQQVSELAELVWVEKPAAIGNGLFLTGPIPRITAFENTGGKFFIDKGCTQPDQLVDDQAAFMETPAGTMVILGCAHAGVINTLRYIQSLTDNRPIHTVIGGMHLLHADAERMNNTIAELRRLNVSRLLPCHCTGMDALVRLWQEFPGKCQACPVGSIIEL